MGAGLLEACTMNMMYQQPVFTLSKELCLKSKVSPILHLGVSLEFWSQPGVSASQQQQISQLAEVVL